ncbi:MAG: Gfo/Idh/MocA family protein [Oscillospiraceae bacterium]
MKENVKVALIGCGGIAFGKHLPALAALENVQITAFCDIIEERAQKAAKQYGIPEAKTFTDYRRLLAEADATVVHVCTPNRSHSPITVAALESGRHVLCEAHGDKRGAGKGHAGSCQTHRQKALDCLPEPPPPGRLVLKQACANGSRGFTMPRRTRCADGPYPPGASF